LQVQNPQWGATVQKSQERGRLETFMLVLLSRSEEIPVDLILRYLNAVDLICNRSEFECCRSALDMQICRCCGSY
jgi:hypothetical protein